MPDDMTDLDRETAAMVAILRALRDISPAGRVRIAGALTVLAATDADAARMTATEGE